MAAKKKVVAKTTTRRRTSSRALGSASETGRAKRAEKAKALTFKSKGISHECRACGNFHSKDTLDAKKPHLCAVCGNPNVEELTQEKKDKAE